MPEYLFEHPKTKKIKSIILSMSSEKKYIDEEGVEWNRVWTPPRFSIDTKVNPYSAQEFTEKTRNKKGTLGDIMDYSKELSEKRGGENDPLKKKYYEDWSKKRKGKEHPEILDKKRKNARENMFKKVKERLAKGL